MASVPELPKRHSGRPNRRGELARRRRSASSVGWAKCVPARDPVADRRDDRRVGVAGQRDAVAAVQVGVLVAVDVVQLGARAVAEPDRVRLGDLPAGGGAAGERAASPGGHPARSGCRRQEVSLLLGDDFLELLALVPGAVLGA